MKNVIRFFLIFAGGVGVGIAGSSFFFKKKYEAKYAKLADEEIDEMRKYYDEKLDMIENSVDEAFTKEVFGEKDEQKEVAPKEAPRGPVLMKTNATDYTLYYKPEKPAQSAETEHPEDDEEEPNDIQVPADVREAIKYRDPHPIKNEEYGQNRRYDTMELRYYTEDDVLTVGDDQDEEILTNFGEEEDVIKGLIRKFKFNTNDQEVFCIRNDARMTDYHITKVFGPFYE